MQNESARDKPAEIAYAPGENTDQLALKRFIIVYTTVTPKMHTIDTACIHMPLNMH